MKRLLSLVVLLGFPVLLHAQAQPGFYFYEDNSFGAFVFEVQESGTVEFNLYDRQTLA